MMVLDVVSQILVVLDVVSNDGGGNDYCSSGGVMECALSGDNG